MFVLLLLHADVLYLPEEVDWVKFNVDMSGYYMVHYAGEGWNSIIKLLLHNHTALSSNDRASLIHNVFQLVRSVRGRNDSSSTTLFLWNNLVHQIKSSLKESDCQGGLSGSIVLIWSLSCVLQHRKGEARHSSGAVPVPVQRDRDHGCDPGLRRTCTTL